MIGYASMLTGSVMKGPESSARKISSGASDNTRAIKSSVTTGTRTSAFSGEGVKTGTSERGVQEVISLFAEIDQTELIDSHGLASTVFDRRRQVAAQGDQSSPNGVREGEARNAVPGEKAARAHSTERDSRFVVMKRAYEEVLKNVQANDGNAKKTIDILA